MKIITYSYNLHEDIFRLYNFSDGLNFPPKFKDLMGKNVDFYYTKSNFILLNLGFFMITWLTDILQNSSTAIFGASAVVGITLFLLRMAIMFLGGDFDLDDGSLDVELHDTHHDIPSFKLFTIHSIAGFCMMFGLIGLSCVYQFDLVYGYAYAIAFVAGLSTMILIALIFKGALGFQSSGALFNVHATVGLVGTVYQRIPAQSQGKITVVVHGVTRELLAQSHDKKPIESFKLVKISKVIDPEIVEVIEVGRDIV